MKLNLLLAVLVAAAALAACGTSPIDVPKEVKVEVPIACIKPQDRPVRPYLRSKDDLVAMDLYRRTLAIAADWLKLWVYAAELEALVDGCSRIPAAAMNPTSPGLGPG